MQGGKSEVVIYRTADGVATLDVTLEVQTVWLTQVQMARLFGKDVRTVSEHIANVYRERELQKSPTVRKFRIVRKEGSRNVDRPIGHDKLDIIINLIAGHK